MISLDPVNFHLDDDCKYGSVKFVYHFYCDLYRWVLEFFFCVYTVNSWWIASSFFSFSYKIKWKKNKKFQAPPSHSSTKFSPSPLFSTSNFFIYLHRNKNLLPSNQKDRCKHQRIRTKFKKELNIFALALAFLFFFFLASCNFVQIQIKRRLSC